MKNIQPTTTIQPINSPTPKTSPVSKELDLLFSCIVLPEERRGLFAIFSLLHSSDPKPIDRRSLDQSLDLKEMEETPNSSAKEVPPKMISSPEIDLRPKYSRNPNYSNNNDNNNNTNLTNNKNDNSNNNNNNNNTKNAHPLIGGEEVADESSIQGKISDAEMEDCIGSLEEWASNLTTTTTPTTHSQLILPFRYERY